MSVNASAIKTRQRGKQILQAGGLLLVVSGGWVLGQQLLKASAAREARTAAFTPHDAPGIHESFEAGGEAPAMAENATARIEQRGLAVVPRVSTPAAVKPDLDRRPHDTQWAGFDFTSWLSAAPATRGSGPEPESQPRSAPESQAQTTQQMLSPQAENTSSPQKIRVFLPRPSEADGRQATATPMGSPTPSATGDPASAADATPAGEPDEPRDPLEALRERYVDRLVAFYPIGWSSDDPGTRHVGWVTPGSGWGGFVQDEVLKDLTWGYRRIQLHNPFGDDGDWPMELDQSIRAEAAGLNWLTEGFVEAWRPVTRGDYTGGEPVEVIAYMGTARVAEFLDLQADDDWERWLARAEASVALPLAAGMTLAFDSFSLEDEDSFSHRFVERLKARGVKVYIETWPKRSATHWHSTNVLVAENWFERNHRNDNVARRADLTGEVVRLMSKPIDDSEAPDATKRRVIEALLAGYTVSLRSQRMVDQVVDLDSLLAELQTLNHASYD